jgi:hypothetical protein
VTAAALRPDDWDWPLFLHVVGAMLLVGTLLAASIVLVADWRRRRAGQPPTLATLGAKILLLGVVPSYVLMRIGAEWIYSREGIDDDNVPGWLDFGYAAADLGALLLIIALVAAGLSVRRARRGGGGTGFAAVAGVLSVVVLIAYVVVVWAMTAKPGA